MGSAYLVNVLCPAPFPCLLLFPCIPLFPVPLSKFEMSLLGGLLSASIEVDPVMDICIKPLEGWKTSVVT